MLLSAKHLSWSRLLPGLMMLQLTSLVGAQGQTAAPPIDIKLFAGVPAEARNRLIERLGFFLQYDRAGDYEKKFGLLTEEDRERQKLNRTEYVRLMQGLAATGKLERNVEFRVTHLKPWIVGDLHEQMMTTLIYGRSKFQRGKKTKTAQRLLEARFESGDWYFSDWLQELTNY